MENVVIDEAFNFVMLKKLVELDRLAYVDHTRTYIEFFQKYHEAFLGFYVVFLKVRTQFMRKIYLFNDLIFKFEI